MSLNTPITLEALKVVDAIEQRGSYAAAAEQLNKVPSALSYIIQKLEEQLDVTLFQKQGRKSVLTPSGKYLLDEGRLILQAMNKLGEQTRIIANGWESKIKIGIDAMLNSPESYRVIKKFLDRYPDIQIDVCEVALSGGWEALIHDDIDLLVGGIHPIPQKKGIHATPLQNFELVYAVSPEHPIAKQSKKIYKNDLVNERSVVLHDSVKSSVPWSKGLLDTNRYFYVSNISDKIKAQVEGIGGGFLPKHQIEDHLESGRLLEIAIEDALTPERLELQIAWKIVNRGKGLKALRDLFIQAANTPS